MKSPSRQVITRDIKTSMNLLLRNDMPPTPIDSNTNLKRLICQAPDIICRELEVIGWRYKTSLPIIKPVHYSMPQFTEERLGQNRFGMRMPANESPKKSNNSVIDTKILIQFVKNHPEAEKYSLEVVIESIQHRLSDLGCLPFTQIIYLLKEMMIGYDVLLDIFGAFQPNDEMIAVSNLQWRVWINQDYTSNSKTDKSPNLGEKEFIYKLIFIAEKHCTPTNLSKLFFSEMKEFTYNKECTFIKVLEKIKEFIAVNKVFQCNKVAIASEKKISDSTEIDAKKNFGQFGANTSLNNNNGERKGLPFGKGRIQGSGFLQFQSKSSTNLMDTAKYNTSMMITPSTTTNPHKMMNVSAIQYNKNGSSNFMQAQTRTFNTNPAFTAMRIAKPNDDKSFKSSEAKHINAKINQSVTLQGIAHRKFPYQLVKPLSPQPNINRQATSFINTSKSRHELKALVNPKKSKSPDVAVVQEKKPKKPARKYSQQIVKVKSLQALTSKKFAGSNIYTMDPENKVAVNVIKTNKTKMGEVKNSSDQDQKLLSPSYSNPSTKQVKDSGEHRTNNEDKYLSLKMNDLGCKLRINQSSYYGMGNSKPEEKRDKNMAVSYNFHNKNDQNSSDASQRNDNKRSNNWTKKISGLFSDDASIKHLKGSVNFKTAEDKLFEKQYLKDVKLEMLQKFGRPVRHSIVDEEDDFDISPANNPYKSMQLIEEVFEDGKSHFEKEEEQEDLPTRGIRKRNQTVQIGTINKQELIRSEIEKKKDCISEYCESEQLNSQQGGFNFQSEPYIRKRH